ncbi:MAG: hypothetical protein ACD_8C00009G0005 [uncultured bacterium]|nr:MAG: hypothetical protein ACD_8C00009G0005 [uncultured bacterium]
MKKIVEIGTFLLVFLLPWQTRWIFEQGMINGNQNEYLTGSVYVADVVIVLVVVLLAINKYRENMIASIFKFSIKRWSAFFLFVILTAISVFWADNVMLAVQRAGWILLAAILAFLIASFKSKTRLLFCFISGLMLSAWLGIWQFFAQNAFASKWLGLASHSVVDGGVSYLEIYSENSQMIRHLRSYGSFDHPNIFGYAMALGIILVLWLFYEKKRGKNENIFLYVALVSFSFGLFSSLSRSAFLALILAMVAVFFRIGFLKIIKPLVVVFFILATLTFWHSELIFARTDFGARLEQKSINERALYFNQGKEIISENVFFGVGVGNYVQELTVKNPKDSAWTYQPVHNVFLLVWAEVGFFAMLLLLALSVSFGFYAWKKSVFHFAMWLSLLSPIFLDHWLWDLHFGVILLGFVVGITVGANNNFESV